jgi:predicted amidohydrolase
MRGVFPPPHERRVVTRSIAVAALQLRAGDRGDFPGGLESTLDALRRAAKEADLVVLPEATFPAYVLGNEPLDDGAIEGAIERVREIARESATVIVAGVAVRDGGVRNAAVVVDADGSIAGRADKLFLWHFDRRWFERGERLAPIATRAGVLGVLICADGRLPTISRALVDRGAEALVMPTAWVTSGRNPQALENVQADLLARVRAYENRVPFIAANKCGSELGMVAYCGKSQVIDANGEILGLASERETQALYARITLGAEPAPRARPAQPARRHNSAAQTLRLAMAYEPLPPDIDERLALLDDAYAIAPEDHARLRALDEAVPLASVNDETVLDPGGLVPFRRAGYVLFCWATGLRQPWLERVARARAIELRVYLVVFDHVGRRAFAVDPDGVVIAGTFDDYRLASFAFDPRKTVETTVAPGSDVRDALEDVAEIIAREEILER